MNTWLNHQPLWVIGLLLVAGMFLFLRLGRMAALHYASRFGKLPDGSKTLIASLLALTAFILGFAFNMSISRYEARRESIVAEANAIGTAIWRADLYPDSMRKVLRGHFKEYLHARIAFFKVGTQYDSALYWEGESNKRAALLWASATEYGRNSRDLIANQLMVPALNDMFDSANTRHYLLVGKVPEPIVYLLFLLGLTSAFFASYNSPKEKINYLVSVTFCLLTVLVVLLVLDLDRPRRGLILFNDTHQAIESLESNFPPNEK